MSRTSKCRRCSTPIIWTRTPPPPGLRRHAGRGLCQPCYLPLLCGDELLDFERRNRDRDEVLDDWQLLRSEGYAIRQAADRMGMTVWALRRAIGRARRDGDPRALPAPADWHRLARTA